MESAGTRPLEVLGQSSGKRVLVSVRGGREYRGILRATDVHFNLLLEESERVARNREGEGPPVQHRWVLIRGDSVVYVSP